MSKEGETSLSIKYLKILSPPSLAGELKLTLNELEVYICPIETEVGAVGNEANVDVIPEAKLATP